MPLSPEDRESDTARHISIGIGVGSQQMFGLLVDLNGDVLKRPVPMAHLGAEGRAIGRRDLVRTDVDAVVSSITELVDELRGLRPDLDEQKALLGVGVSIGGHVNGRTGEVVRCPQLDWTSPVPLAALLKEKNPGLETVVVENDVNALAMGAQLFGDVTRAVPAGVDPASYSSFAVVRLQTGIGVGLVLGTDLYRGVTGVAGEFGHFPIEEAGQPCVCGKRGCLETLASGTAILRAIREKRKVEDIDAAAALVRSGDDDAREAFEQAGTALGGGLAGLVNLLNLRLIILCGEPAMLKCEPYMARVRESFRERAFSTAAEDCELRTESRTDELEARGAASMVFDHLYDYLLDG